MDLNLYGEIIFLVLGILVFMNYKEVARYSWLGFPNNWWRKNPWATQWTGLGFMLIGIFSLVRSFF